MANKRINQYPGKVLGSAHGVTSEQELTALRKENAQLKQENEILKKATVGSIGRRNSYSK